jgi:hypothetical protein
VHVNSLLSVRPGVLQIAKQAGHRLVDDQGDLTHERVEISNVSTALATVTGAVSTSRMAAAATIAAATPMRPATLAQRLRPGPASCSLVMRGGPHG